MSAMNMKRIIKTDTMTEFLNMAKYGVASDTQILPHNISIFEGSGTSLTFRSIPRMFKYDFFHNFFRRFLSFRIESYT